MGCFQPSRSLDGLEITSNDILFFKIVTMPDLNSQTPLNTKRDSANPPQSMVVAVTKSADFDSNPVKTLTLTMPDASQTSDAPAISFEADAKPVTDGSAPTAAVFQEVAHKAKSPTKANPKSKRIISGRDEINDDLVADVCKRLSGNLPVRRVLPEGGRVHIDRQLPFVCIYRQPADTADPGTESLVTGEASYIVAPGSSRRHRELAKLVNAIAEIGVETFGAFLIVEVWAKTKPGSEVDPRAIDVHPTFNLFAPGTNKLDSTVEALARHLKRIKVLKQPVQVETERGPLKRAGKLKTLVAKERANKSVYTVGIEVPPVYRNEAADGKLQEFPLLLKTFRRRFGLAVRRGVFEFTDDQTLITPPHYHVLGRRAVVKAVWDVDRKLAAVGTEFDYLLHVTPINSYEAWNEFKRKKFESAPEFHYLPLPFDPYLLKRQLYDIKIERIEDPALANIFREKQQELDRKITMLQDRNTPRFLHGSQLTFGPVSDSLFDFARLILEEIPQSSGRRKGAKSEKNEDVNAEAFVKCADEEFAYYRSLDPTFGATARVTPKVAGVMVSRGQLLVNKRTVTPQARVDALLQHEVGTHILTHHNGRAQPFNQLRLGLAGYEELQEGLAVLAEYLVGGLSRYRIRQLAGRVIAARMLIDRASFVETFRALDDTYHFSQQTAYNITMRIFRGGGLTKDAVYLRGFRDMVKYIQKGGDIEPLFVGKIADVHIPIIKELQHRKVLNPTPLRPRYMERPEVIERLQRLQTTKKPFVDLIRESL